MRGADITQESLFVMKQTTDYIPVGHPLIAIREILNQALRKLDSLFASIYEDRGRYSVPPEWLLRGLVLQALYGIRRDRLIEHEVIKALFGQVMKQAQDADLLSAEHFSVDGTLIRAWASHKSFAPKDGSPP